VVIATTTITITITITIIITGDFIDGIK